MGIFDNRVMLVNEGSRSPTISIFGEIISANKSVIVDISFDHHIPAIKTLTPIQANGATITWASSQAIWTSGTNSAAHSQLQTKSAVVHHPGCTSWALFTCEWDVNDGQFGIFYRIGGVTQFIPQTAFNMDHIDGTGPNGFRIDPTKMNLFKISFGYSGIAPTIFEVMGEDGRMIPFHIIKFPNSQQGPSILNPSLPIRGEQIKSGSNFDQYIGMIDDNDGFSLGFRSSNLNANSIMKSACWVGGVDKGTLSEFRSECWTAFHNVTANATFYQYNFSVQNKITFLGKTNYSIAELIDLSAVSSLVGLGVIALIRNGTIGGVPNFVDIDTNESALAIDTSGTSISGGTYDYLFGFNGSQAKDTRGLFIHLHPGDILTFAINGPTTASVFASSRWREHL